MVAGHLQEKRGTFYIVLNTIDECGKRVTKWIPTGLPVKGNKKRAEAMLLEARSSFIPETIVQPVRSKEMQFADFIENVWLPYAKKSGIETTTYAEYTHEVDVIATYFRMKKLSLSEVRAFHIDEFYSYLLDDKDDDGLGLSGTTAKKYHSRIHSAFKYAVRQLEWIEYNPADNVSQPKSIDYMASFYNAADADNLLEKIKGHKLELAVMLGLYGLRRSEIVGLKWQAVDFVKNTICISFTVTQCTLNNKKVLVAKPRAKTKKSLRTLPMIPSLRNKLLEMKAKQEEYRQLFGKSYDMSYSEFVYVNELGVRVEPEWITRAFPKFLKSNRLRRIRFHDLRHSCASLLIANGVSMKQIQEWLGHSTYVTTANMYTHLEFDSKLSSAMALQKSTALGRVDMIEPKRKRYTIRRNQPFAQTVGA